MSQFVTLPKLIRVEHYVDSAFKTGIANDFSVCATWGVDQALNAYLLALWRRRVEFPDLVSNLVRIWQTSRYRGPLVIEDKASGQSAIQVLKRQGIPTIAWPGKDKEARKMLAASKESRADAVTWLVESGKVFVAGRRDEGGIFVPASREIEEFIDEHAAFPSGSHDDMVDTTSMALLRMVVWRRAAMAQAASAYEVGDAGRRKRLDHDPFAGEQAELERIGRELIANNGVAKLRKAQDFGEDDRAWAD